MNDVYERLRQRLDDMGTGFPATKNGIEIKILKQIFTQADAEMVLMMSPMLETPDSIAARLNLPPEDTAKHIEDMARRGLVFRQKKDGVARYAAVPFVVGIFEFQLNSVNETLARDMEEYYQAALGKSFQAWSTPVMRTIPINKELVTEWPIAPYEDVMKIFDNQKKLPSRPASVEPWPKRPAKVAISRWRPVFSLVPMRVFMWITAWGGISPLKRPRRLPGRMKPPGL